MAESVAEAPGDGGPAALGETGTSRELLQRLRQLEAENSALAQANENQRETYERCLDEVANHVVQALLNQKDLREECLKLKKRVFDLERQNQALSDLFQQKLQLSAGSLPQLPLRPLSPDAPATPQPGSAEQLPPPLPPGRCGPSPEVTPSVPSGSPGLSPGAPPLDALSPFFKKKAQILEVLRKLEETDPLLGPPPASPGSPEPCAAPAWPPCPLRGPGGAGGWRGAEGSPCSSPEEAAPRGALLSALAERLLRGEGGCCRRNGEAPGAPPRQRRGEHPSFLGVYAAGEESPEGGFAPLSPGGGPNPLPSPPKGLKLPPPPPGALRLSPQPPRASKIPCRGGNPEGSPALSRRGSPDGPPQPGSPEPPAFPPPRTAEAAEQPPALPGPPRPPRHGGLGPLPPPRQEAPRAGLPALQGALGRPGQAAGGRGPRAPRPGAARARPRGRAATPSPRELGGQPEAPRAGARRGAPGPLLLLRLHGRARQGGGQGTPHRQDPAAGPPGPLRQGRPQPPWQPHQAAHQGGRRQSRDAAGRGSGGHQGGRGPPQSAGSPRAPRYGTAGGHHRGEGDEGHRGERAAAAGAGAGAGGRGQGEGGRRLGQLVRAAPEQAAGAEPSRRWRPRARVGRDAGSSAARGEDGRPQAGSRKPQHLEADGEGGGSAEGAAGGARLPPRAGAGEGASARGPPAPRPPPRHLPGGDGRDLHAAAAGQGGREGRGLREPPGAEAGALRPPARPPRRQRPPALPPAPQRHRGTPARAPRQDTGAGRGAPGRAAVGRELVRVAALCRLRVADPDVGQRDRDLPPPRLRGGPRQEHPKTAGPSRAAGRCRAGAAARQHQSPAQGPDAGAGGAQRRGAAGGRQTPQRPGLPPPGPPQPPRRTPRRRRRCREAAARPAEPELDLPQRQGLRRRRPLPLPARGAAPARAGARVPRGVPGGPPAAAPRPERQQQPDPQRLGRGGRGQHGGSLAGRGARPPRAGALRVAQRFPLRQPLLLRQPGLSPPAAHPPPPSSTPLQAPHPGGGPTALSPPQRPALPDGAIAVYSPPPPGF